MIMGKRERERGIKEMRGIKGYTTPECACRFDGRGR